MEHDNFSPQENRPPGRSARSSQCRCCFDWTEEDQEDDDAVALVILEELGWGLKTMALPPTGLLLRRIPVNGSRDGKEIDDDGMDCDRLSILERRVSALYRTSDSHSFCGRLQCI